MESLEDFKDFDGANNSIQFIKNISIRSTSENLRINDKREINTKKIKQGEVDSNIYYKNSIPFLILIIMQNYLRS